MAANSNVPIVHMGVVSPCSTCKNRQADSANGLPMCPRMYWGEVATESDASFPDFLSASGTDQQDKLVNPVYLEEASCVVVWVASLESNQGYFQDGKRINPDILHPGFDTKYIVCNAYPYAIQTSEAEMYQGGVYKEMDQLELLTFPINQLDILGQRLPLAGFAKKVTFVAKHTFLIPDEDLLIPGT